jgi:hypothetical protein
MPQNHDHD